MSSSTHCDEDQHCSRSNMTRAKKTKPQLSISTTPVRRPSFITSDAIKPPLFGQSRPPSYPTIQHAENTSNNNNTFTNNIENNKTENEFIKSAAKTSPLLHTLSRKKSIQFEKDHSNENMKQWNSQGTLIADGYNTTGGTFFTHAESRPSSIISDTIIDLPPPSTPPPTEEENPPEINIINISSSSSISSVELIQSPNQTTRRIILLPNTTIDSTTSSSSPLLSNNNNNNNNDNNNNSKTKKSSSSWTWFFRTLLVGTGRCEACTRSRTESRHLRTQLQNLEKINSQLTSKLSELHKLKHRNAVLSEELKDREYMWSFMLKERLRLIEERDDVISELEALTQSLFEEANKMVADERRMSKELQLNNQDLSNRLDDMVRKMTLRLESVAAAAAATSSSRGTSRRDSMVSLTRIPSMAVTTTDAFERQKRGAVLLG